MVTVGNNDTSPPLSDSLLGEFTKASNSRISETSPVRQTVAPQHGAWIIEASDMLSGATVGDFAFFFTTVASRGGQTSCSFTLVKLTQENIKHRNNFPALSSLARK